MSKKNKQARGRRPKELDHVQIAQRELLKHNAKLALEHARLGHQQSPDEESREVLERAMLARAEQLRDHGKHDLAKELLNELTVLGVTVSELAQPLERLRVFLGLAPSGDDTGVDRTVALPEELAASLADEAILRPQRRSSSYAEMNEQADLVRDVLRSMENGDDSDVERLAKIPRKSPFADWRLLARGLAAYYAGDAERMAANWDRLDPQRPAYRIANQMLVFSGQRQPEECDFDVATGQRRLHFAAAGNPVVSQLESIRDHFQSNRMNDALQMFRSFRHRNGKTHRKLLGRLTDLLWKRLVREDDERWLGRLTRLAPGPPLDPHWHRARALALEEQGDGSLNRLELLWKAYVNDLQHCTALSEEERQVASALVLLRLAREFVELADSEENRDVSLPWEDEEVEEQYRSKYIAELRRQAEKYLREAIRRYSPLLNAHRELVSLLRDADQPDGAIEAARQLLKEFPDHFETLTWLGNYFMEADKPADAEPYVETASRLRPRDQATQALIWNQRLGMLRHSVRKRRFEEARQQLQEAFATPPAGTYLYLFDVLQATIEYKAKNFEAAETHLKAAQGQLQEPTAIWLMMHAFADRYGLDRQLKNDFRDRFKAAVSARCTSQTAGHMATFLRGFLARGVKYVGLATHQRLVLAYLGRIRKLDWQLDDLRNVCEFLRVVDKWQSRDLRRRMVAEGCKRFPQDPLFLLLSAADAMESGPFHANFDRIERDLEGALELSKSAVQPLSEADVEMAKTCLSAVHSAKEMMASLMGAMPGFMAGAFGVDEEDDGDDDDDWDDDWEDDDWYEDDDEEDASGTARKNAGSTGGRSRRRASGSSEKQRYFDF